MDVKECLENGLLKKDKPDINKAKRSIEIAKSKLGKAEQLLEFEICDMALVNCYSSMFHSARALLFKDGFKEKSHYAVYVYLKERYYSKIELKFLNELNILRLDRHEVFYALEEPELDKAGLKKSIKLAGEFIESINKILEN